MTTDDCALARKHHRPCVLDMRGEELDGSTPTGDGHRINLMIYGTSASLIRVRRDFIPEIVRSADQLD